MCDCVICPFGQPCTRLSCPMPNLTFQIMSVMSYPGGLTKVREDEYNPWNKTTVSFHSLFSFSFSWRNISPCLAFPVCAWLLVVQRFRTRRPTKRVARGADCTDCSLLCSGRAACQCLQVSCGTSSHFNITSSAPLLLQIIHIHFPALSYLWFQVLLQLQSGFNNFNLKSTTSTTYTFASLKTIYHPRCYPQRKQISRSVGCFVFLYSLLSARYISPYFLWQACSRPLPSPVVIPQPQPPRHQLRIPTQPPGLRAL